MRIKFLIILVFFLLNSIVIHAQFYNGSQVEFGKCRIQYKLGEWSFYRFDRFDVFFYVGGKELSIRIAKCANQILKETEDRFGYELEDRFQIILFDRLSDLKQNNLGTSGESRSSLGGTRQRIGSKILIYAGEGDVSVIKQLRSGISELMVSAFLIGTDLRDRLRTSATMNIPFWYHYGLISWFSESWSSEMENLVRDGFIYGRISHLESLTGRDAVIAGHAFWYYIADKFGEGLIPDILDHANATRSIDEGFKVILGMSTKELIKDWVSYFMKNFAGSQDLFDAMHENLRSGKSHSGDVFSQIKISPDGEKLIWVKNNHGKKSIWISSFDNRKSKKIASFGSRLADITDHSFPIIAWNPNGKEFIWSEELEGRLRLSYFNTETNKTEYKWIDFLQKIYSMDIASDGKNIVMSGVRNGKLDLFIFNNSTNIFKQITDDFWDEKDPKWLDGNTSFSFTSNRTSDSVLIRQEVPVKGHAAHDIFLCKLSGPMSNFLRLTQTPR